MSVSEPERPFVLTVCENGYGKRTNIEEFRVQKRGGKGIILIDASDRNGPVVDVMLVKDVDEVMLMTDRGQTLRTRVGEIRETGRNAQGVKIMSVEEGEKIVALEKLAEEEAAAGESIAPPPEGSGGGSSAPPPPPDVN
jgi:DNA gyrase subunit A